MADDLNPDDVEKARRRTARQEAAARAAGPGRNNPRAYYEGMMTPDERSRQRGVTMQAQAEQPRYGVPTEAEQRERLVRQGQRVLDQRNASTNIPDRPANASRVTGTQIPRIPEGAARVTGAAEAAGTAAAESAAGRSLAGRLAAGASRAAGPIGAAATAIQLRQALRNAAGVDEAKEAGRRYLREQRAGTNIPAGARAEAAPAPAPAPSGRVVPSNERMQGQMPRDIGVTAPRLPGKPPSTRRVEQSAEVMNEISQRIRAGEAPRNELERNLAVQLNRLSGGQGLQANEGGPAMKKGGVVKKAKGGIVKKAATPAKKPVKKAMKKAAGGPVTPMPKAPAKPKAKALPPKTPVSGFMRNSKLLMKKGGAVKKGKK